LLKDYSALEIEFDGLIKCVARSRRTQ